MYLVCLFLSEQMEYVMYHLKMIRCFEIVFEGDFLSTGCSVWPLILVNMFFHIVLYIHTVQRHPSQSICK